MLRTRTATCLLMLFALSAFTACAAPPSVTLHQAAYRDRVYACFLGKNIGGTLGMPVEGQRETHNFTFYTPVPREPAANDDLDLQLLWLKGLQDYGPQLTARDLGDLWLKYVPVDWNEYGVGKANMRAGFPPPLSGQVRNRMWRDSNGAWIRSEIWACVAPGCPSLAAKYAWNDACVDHGAAEGTWAEVFTATVESAAFVESDPYKLIAIGLSYIPADCAVATSVKAAMKAYEQKLDLMAAREAVVKASESTGWFMAPQNVAFVVLGWLYGEGDFGRSICAAVNCGDDTDCTGATLGSLLGIIRGTAGIPEDWRKPVGEKIMNVAIGGFQPPATLDDLTSQVVAVTPSVLRYNGVAVDLQAGANPSPVSVRGMELVSPNAARDLWARSPYRVEYRFTDLDASLDFGTEPVIAGGETHKVRLVLHNSATHARRLRVEWRPALGLRATPRVKAVALSPGQAASVECALMVIGGEVTEALLPGSVSIGEAGIPGELTVPMCFAGRVSVHADDLALASKGATATSDSELEREAGCTARAIDGIIATPEAFDGVRWHSALTPHPHWVAVDLGKQHSVKRVVVHFADPQGHPVDFDGEASSDGTHWTALLSERGYAGERKYETALGNQPLRYFRLVIRRSASSHWPDAAQVSEIELLGQ
jgi:ADP-ribosylglycohydrolase